MTEKIRLKDGTELIVIPMGIDTRDKLRIIKFITDLPYEELLAKFNAANIERIDYILADNRIGATYEDCVAFKSLTYIPDVQIDDNNTADIYAVILSTDPIESSLKGIDKKMQMTIAAVDMLLTEFIPMIIN